MSDSPEKKNSFQSVQKVQNFTDITSLKREREREKEGHEKRGIERVMSNVKNEQTTKVQ